MNVQIVTPDSTVFEGDASLVQLPGIDGSFEIMNNHAPMISILREGKVKVQRPDKTLEFFDIRGGVVEVLGNKVLLLAE
ncbi:MAG TPA: ATP synthase F1 subunit epsilon [Bacteroidales bacterium]|nr:ATP synthase F1 subunit epsilon [Bacteroidales bacterium]HRZ76240.1 ATP synthase F1 subunit epsilon [Bacteroidales bacterium]